MLKSKLFSILSARRTFPVALALGLLLPASRLHGVSGLEGTFEYGLDAPWRLEPNMAADGTPEYGAIPIQISILDAKHAPFDDAFYFGPQFGPSTIHLPPSILTLGKFHSVRVTEFEPTQTNTVEFALNALHEIEVSGDWRVPVNPTDPAPPPPDQALCRIWKGENPEPFRVVANSSEWHATLWYAPRNKTPGTWVALQVEVVLERDPWPPRVNFPVSELVASSPFMILRNYVRVYLPHQPLPRFDSRWLYGDLHYHSQGTDNEGEGAYNYRGVIRAMGAMGLDFLFATDHASSSEQFVDIDLSVDLVEEGLGKFAGWLGLPGGDSGDSLEESDVKIPFRGFLRDMDAARYSNAHDLIYAADGVNREASFRASNFRFPQNFKSYGVVPQLFLGGEVDAVPEARIEVVGPLPQFQGNPNSLKDRVRHLLELGNWQPNPLPYGNQALFDLNHMRDGGKESVYQLFEPAGDAYLIRDFQGLDRYDLYGRAHLVYFPASAEKNVGNETSFIPSFTSKYGGATRRLDADHAGQKALLPEIERKGVAFVAHHLNACGKCSPGPDGVPWTLDHMLLKAFRSSAILGLEFWNEDTRYRSKICSHEYCRDDSSYFGVEIGYERAENPSVFGYVPDEVKDVGLPLAEYRHGFLHSKNGVQGLFELNAFDVQNGLWQRPSDETEHALHQGAHDWDQLNLLGLDFERNKELPWLKPGEPRRVFMGGGSDAHGDLNYRRAGYLVGTEDANDTAIGKPRNLLFVGVPEGPVLYSEGPVAEDPTRTDDRGGVGPVGAGDGGVIGALSLLSASAAQPQFMASLRPIDDSPLPEPPSTEEPTSPIRPPLGDPVSDPTPTEPTTVPLPPIKIPIDDIRPGPSGVVIRAHTQEQIIRALQQGRFCVTDGPALRIAIDLNGNQQIDDSDIQMGDFYSFDPLTHLGQQPHRGQKLTLLAEVISTEEFGPITKVDVYVGVHPGSTPPPPGILPEPRVYAPDDHAVRSSRDPRGVLPTGGLDTNTRLVDGYWQDNRLRFTPPPGSEFRFTAVAVLDLDSFEAGQGVLADRFFVRAFAATQGNLNSDQPNRYAFSNPIWMRRNEGGFDLPVADASTIAPVEAEAALTRDAALKVITSPARARSDLGLENLSWKSLASGRTSNFEL